MAEGGFVPGAARAAECLKTTRAAKRARAKVGGGRGIRTPRTLPGTVVFKTTAIDHSAIPPRRKLARIRESLQRPDEPDRQCNRKCNDRDSTGRDPTRSRAFPSSWTELCPQVFLFVPWRQHTAESEGRQI